MPIESNEQFTGRASTISANGWTAQRHWLVTGARNELECFAATSLDQSPIPGTGNSHPLNALLRVDNHSLTQTGPFSWEVVANYIIPQDQILTDPKALDLLKLPPKISWRKGNYGEATDRDIDKKPVVNAAGDPFDPAPQLIRRERYLRIWRYEPFFDIAKSAAFEDRVNSNQFQMGKIIVLPGECLCESIEPIEEYTTDALAIPIAYDFVIRVRFTANNARINPFQTHLQNKGRRGWYTRSGTATLGEFCYADKRQVTEPVALDMTGKPLDSTIKVLGGSVDAPTAETPIANPNNPGLTESPLSTPQMKSLQFKLLHEADFSQLGL